MEAGLIFDNFKWIYDKGDTYLSNENQKLKDDFNNIVKKYFESLELVNKDYWKEQLAAYKNYLGLVFYLLALLTRVF